MEDSRVRIIDYRIEDYTVILPGDAKEFHQLDRTYIPESKRYEDKQGISIYLNGYAIL